MRVLDKPTNSPKEIFLTCISRVRDSNLKSRFESVADIIENEADNFETEGQRRAWFRISEATDVGGVVSKDEMEKVYVDRMAKIGAPGRDVYNTLKSASPLDRCPLCGHRPVGQLDHYLPKSKFPALAVLPANLVPSCESCNKKKNAEGPTSKSEQFLHPYYDDVTKYAWLCADVVEVAPAKVKFFVCEVPEFGADLNSRISFHFNSLELNKLYSVEAGVLLADIRFRLSELYQKNGKEEVRQYLVEEGDSRRKTHVNSWQTATYMALARSEWFCDGGFGVG